MWVSFKEMPTPLKFITGHAIACIFLLLGSVIPHDSFSMYGQPVSYAVWWSSGAGLYASFLGAIMPVTAYLMLKRLSRARIIYLVALSIAIVAPYLYWGQLQYAAIDMVVVGLFGWYLYGAKSVQRYFTSNPPFKRDALKRAP
jgi:hypothetical protein